MSVTALALLLLAAACTARAPREGTSRADGAPSPEVTRGGTATVLRVGTSGDYPPFSVRAADGTLAGFDVEVARAYARDRGRPLELVPFAWPDLERRLIAGDFDVAMSGVTVRGERIAHAPMTAAVARADAVLLVPAAGSAAIPEQGAGLQVAVNRGGHLERVARRQLPRATLVLLDDNRSLPAVLASGDVDAVVTDSLEVESFNVAGRPSPRVARVLSRDRKAYWVSPHEPELADDLDAWLAQREADGSLAAQRARAFGAAAAAPYPSGDVAAARLVDLVARRLLLMPEVAAAKRVASLPVDAPAREQEVYTRARAAAVRAGLAPEPYVELVRAQIEAAKVVQRAVLAQPEPDAGVKHDAEAVAQAKARLESELRPAIDRLDAGIRAALVAAAPLGTPAGTLAALLRADAPVPGFGEAQAAGLARALRSIPAAGPAAKSPLEQSTPAA